MNLMTQKMPTLSYEQHRDLQFVHWWFEGRRRCVRELLRMHFRKIGFSPGRVLDIGSGYGSMFPVLKEFGEVHALEPYDDCAQKLLSMGVKKVYSCPLEDFDSSERFDLITMFDVLEHIQDDRKMLDKVRQQLSDRNGHFAVTVPAYQALWSYHDEFLGHFRRYDKGTLTALLRSTGFRVCRITYFMSFLFVPGALQRVFDKMTGTRKPRLESGKSMNSILLRIFCAESSVLRSHDFPLGLSLFALCSKR